MTLKSVLKGIWTAGNDHIQYKEGMIKTQYKLEADILNVVWRLCSGSGIIIAGLCVSAYAQHEIATLISMHLSSSDAVVESIVWSLAIFIFGVTPAITGDVFGAMQLWVGKDIVHFEEKVKKEVKE